MYAAERPSVDTTMRRTVPFPVQDDVGVTRSPIAVPPGHFLAARPRQPPHGHHQQHQSPLADGDVTPTTAWRQRGRPDTSSLAAADFDVSVQTGFLPPDEPVQRLDLPVWSQLEQALDHTQRHVSQLKGGGLGRLSDQWRREVEQLPEAPTEYLTTLPQYRRAHVILSYLAHFYMHSTYPSQTHVPASIARPWVLVSEQLSMPPILTYADTVLWNWRLLDPALGIRADNMAITTMFTNSPSEHAFFMLSLLCEMHGPVLLRLMSATLDEAFFADDVSLQRIATYLSQMTLSINELTSLMRAATKGQFGAKGRERIVPEVFYWEVRPWFNGGKWTFQGAGQRGEDVTMEWGGPSAGQSSLVHALDLFLGVDHSPRPQHQQASTSSSSSSSSSSSESAVVHASARVMDAEAPLPPSTNEPSKPVSVPLSDSTFMARMSHYMPGFHRQFLQHLSSLHVPNPSAPFPVPSVRSLAQQHKSALGEAYDTTVKAMKLFRDEHMRLATVFIISQARREPGRDTVFWPEWHLKEIERQKNVVQEREQLRGTGGTDLVVFLKQCRDRTKEALIEA
ncbi:hypothetical protein OIV83_006084 [Microbotryomycetes sp. JL201]|nr:hypothetical protein OIV83_006084 [Microbotryomycetes sp. JL201]